MIYSLRDVRYHKGHHDKPHTHPHFHKNENEFDENGQYHSHLHFHSNESDTDDQTKDQTDLTQTQNDQPALSKTLRIEVMEDIYGENARLATDVNHSLHQKGVFCVNIMGAPGAGKTSCLIQMIKNLHEYGASVIEGDIESDIDTTTLRKLGVQALQINTGGACHLDAPIIQKALLNLDIPDKSLLFIENIGNLVCPAEFMIGEDIKMLISTTTEGSDKPYKYPLAFEKADCIVINKTDLMPYVDFDEVFFTAGIRALNKTVPIFKVSARTGEGFERLTGWLENRANNIG